MSGASLTDTVDLVFDYFGPVHCDFDSLIFQFMTEVKMETVRLHCIIQLVLNKALLKRMFEIFIKVAYK